MLRGRPGVLEQLRLADGAQGFATAWNGPMPSPDRSAHSSGSISPAPCPIGHQSPTRRVLGRCSSPTHGAVWTGSRQPWSSPSRGVAVGDQADAGRAVQGRQGRKGCSIRLRSRRSSTACSRRGFCGPGKTRRGETGSTGGWRSGTYARPCCGRCSSSSPIPAARGRWVWSRCQPLRLARPPRPKRGRTACVRRRSADRLQFGSSSYSSVYPASPKSSMPVSSSSASGSSGSGRNSKSSRSV